MAAITSVLLTYLRPDDLVLYSIPTYGGTATLMNGLLADFGVKTRPFRSGATLDDLHELVGDDSLAMVYVETPANPTNELFDVGLARRLADAHGARLVEHVSLSRLARSPLGPTSRCTLRPSTWVATAT